MNVFFHYILSICCISILFNQNTLDMSTTIDSLDSVVEGVEKDGESFDSVYEDQIDEISTIQYRVKGTLETPKLERLREE